MVKLENLFHSVESQAEFKRKKLDQYERDMEQDGEERVTLISGENEGRKRRIVVAACNKK